MGMLGRTPRTENHPNPEIDQSDEGFDPYDIDPECSLLVETTEGGSIRVEPDEFQLQDEIEQGDLIALWVKGFTSLRLGETSAPTYIHIPVNTKTASDNFSEKSEGKAYVRTEIVRYSTIINPSNDPNQTVSLDVPYIEIWFDDLEPHN